MIKRVWHTGFVVKDIQRAIEFYRDGMGLHLVDLRDVQGEGISHLVGYKNARLLEAFFSLKPNGTMDDVQVILIEYASPRTDKQMSSERNHTGAAHLAFYVDDVDAAYQRLLAHGAKKLNPPVDVRPGHKVVYLQDPDGNWLELCEDKK
jgi:catechol 2,3-dioxygenase-like lactoylglutathione lyase family enzyme